MSYSIAIKFESGPDTGAVAEFTVADDWGTLCEKYPVNKVITLFDGTTARVVSHQYPPHDGHIGQDNA